MRGFSGRVLAADLGAPVIFAMSAQEPHAGSARDRTRVPFACSRASHVPGVIPVPGVTHPAPQRQFFVDDSGSTDDFGYWGPQSFPRSQYLPR